MTLVLNRNADVLEVFLDRTAQGNRLNAELITELTGVLQTASAAGGPHVVLLAANGPDFSLGRERQPGAVQTPRMVEEEFTRIQALNEALSGCPAVTVAAVHGRAEGAALSLAARCDIVLAARDAQLSFPEIPHGIPPTIVLSRYAYVLPRSILGDLFFGGRVLDGAEAVQFGLAARAVDTELLLPAAREEAVRIASYDRASVLVVKRYLAQLDSIPSREAPAVGIAAYALEMAERAARAGAA